MEKGAIVFLSGALIDVDSTLIFQLVLFFVLFFILRAFLFRPFLELIDAREKAIHGVLGEAKALANQAEAKAFQFDQEMKKLRAELLLEREKLRQETAALERDLIAQSKAEIEQMLQRADAELEQRKAEVRFELKKKMPQMVEAIVKRVIGEER
ncbi:MAG: ATP synthase F0 subunit B [Deltaproteobacteria bacterium]|nr:ATP synthase F0 subunit B [Deltaproteobacteria bacterium]MDW8245841.1 ATP synthase F0 subunit B [Sandaracinaceae bacterium]